MVKAVLFDCDGVLINTEEIGYVLLQSMLKAEGIHYSREAYVEMLSGFTYRQFQEKLRHAHPHLPPRFFEDFSARMKTVEEQQMKAIDGVKELLANLKKNGIPFAVCSNSGMENLLYKLKATGLYEAFTPYIFSRNHVDNPKPAPDMYLHAADIFGVTPKDCLVVEDSATGTMAGIAAGMTVIGFVGEQHREDHEADMLLQAGAKVIGLNMAQVWDHIAGFAGIKPQNPAPGEDFHP